jgi:hypothetical protein
MLAREAQWTWWHEPLLCAACPAQVFVNRVAAHPVLSKSAELQLFLEATEDTWAVEMARGQVSLGSVLLLMIMSVSHSSGLAAVISLACTTNTYVASCRVFSASSLWHDACHINYCLLTPL